MQAKKPSESLTVRHDVVLPGECNPLNQLFGGELLARLDRISAISAARHSRTFVVTASVNQVAFTKPIPMGSVVILEAKVSRAFSTSMEVVVDVWIEDIKENKRIHCNEAIYTFVAVDNDGKPTQVSPIEPETELEKKRYDGALRRHQLSLVLAGRMNPHDATELKALFD